MPLIGTISSLRIISTTKNFVLRYSVTGQVLALFQYLSNPYHPLRRKLERKYAQQENQLNLIVQPTKKALSTKACVRTTIARKLREIAVQELRLRGWGKDGRPIRLPQEKGWKMEQVERKRAPLKGTLAFFPFEEALEAEDEGLRQEVRYGVDRFLRAHREQHGAAPSRSVVRDAKWDGPERDRDREKSDARDEERRMVRNEGISYGRQQQQQQQPPLKEWQQRVAQRGASQNSGDNSRPGQHNQRNSSSDHPPQRQWQSREPSSSSSRQHPSSSSYSPILSQTPRFPRDNNRPPPTPQSQSQEPDKSSDSNRKPINIRFTAPRGSTLDYSQPITPRNDDRPAPTFATHRPPRPTREPSTTSSSGAGNSESQPQGPRITFRTPRAGGGAGGGGGTATLNISRPGSGDRRRRD